MQPAELYLEISRAPSERALASLLLSHGTALTGAPALGYYVLGADGPVEIHARGKTDVELEEYERRGRSVDALHAWVCAHHVPASMDLEALKRFPPFLAFVKQNGIDLVSREYMLAPIVLGEVVGMVHFMSARDVGLAPQAMRFAQGVSANASARVAVLRALGTIASRWDGALTPRELEIAQLAAQGLSTDAMARVAGVSANTIKKHVKALYAKLHVSSRAELGAMLLLGPRSLRPTPRLPDDTGLHGRPTFLHDD